MLLRCSRETVRDATACCDCKSFSGPLRRWEETPSPGDRCICWQEGGTGWAHHWLPWGHNQLRAPKWEAPCAHTISPGQKQAIVGATGSMIAALGALCHPSAVIHAPVQLCLKRRGNDSSAEQAGDYWWKTFTWRWLELLGVAEGKGCAVSS